MIEGLGAGSDLKYYFKVVLLTENTIETRKGDLPRMTLVNVSNGF